MEIIVMAVSTQGFTSEGVDLLVNAVNKILNINSYKLLDSKRLPYIYVKKAEVLIVVEKVIPYMHPSTHYKLGF